MGWWYERDVRTPEWLGDHLLTAFDSRQPRIGDARGRMSRWSSFERRGL
jgi:hypothetical protein